MKKTFLITFLLSALTCLCFGVKDKQLYPKIGGQLIMYGDKPHSEIEAKSAEYIETEVEKFGDREKASLGASDKGWEFVSKAQSPNASYTQVNLAVRMFNGAWVLWEENYNAFWGFGVCSAMRGDYKKSEKYFTKAIELNTENPNAQLRIDAALTYNKSRNSSWLPKAMTLVEEAILIEPNNASAYFVWAQSLALMGDFEMAWAKIEKCEEIGGYSIPVAFLNSLEHVMPRPKKNY